MTNTNCLENIACPQCGKEDTFTIIVLTQAHVTDNGAEPFGDMEWDENSSMTCPCGNSGKVSEFMRERMEDNHAALS